MNDAFLALECFQQQRHFIKGFLQIERIRLTQNVNHSGEQKPAEETVFQVGFISYFPEYVRLDACKNIGVAVIRRANVSMPSA